MKPLYIKLKERKYEKNQILDKESILWLKKKLNLKVQVRLLNIAPMREEYLLQYAPKKHWFNLGRIKTIHGINHALRVIIYSYILCKIHKIDRFEPFLLAASIHDVKRLNDREDINHGKRTSDWFYKSNIKIKKNLSNEEIKEICLAVEGKEDKLKINSILKCADALDRYRLPKKRWWLKKELVPIPIPKKVINFSRYFTIETEEQIIKGKDPLKTVLNLARKCNLISNSEKNQKKVL
tara:strand:- start:2229 stop:2942 length:714 start_codon:yes stop_codon:yes gene_type:complete